ncbi:Similar to Oleic acid lipoxygenase; acc. no. Q8RNT4 [Pyronema omphalodes CBS 100304]|uniref:Manganese lipoxygenase n=1 Tax=Pyronema omphalodes (strain CBS 100304) TaxID=1076935 RepID=U4L7I6_PYROM|nr:Similar to Oleic acid lipoxygenase; acc. no. Q8RNT4 [Pyronema omphalodes CBS 100304]
MIDIPTMLGQQQFTGPNLTPITTIANNTALLNEFVKAATLQKNDMIQPLSCTDPKSLFIQDCRYFREAINVPPVNMKDDIRSNLNAAQKGQYPVVIDYKVTISDSVVIFKKRLQAAQTRVIPPEEKTDWPCRYAKTCSQVADWIRHEIAIHLTHTHLIEEAVIVASQRIFEWDHIITRILYPHWYKTLSLNQAAREILLPKIIFDIVGFSTEKCKAFINYSYNNFNWQEQHAPEDLKKRGFEPSALNDDKFRNYAYAKNIHPMWKMIKSFVSDMFAIRYKCDDDVVADSAIQKWCDEIRDSQKGRIQSFPQSITAFDALANAVTINIIRVSFINKPSALFSAPPKTLNQLKLYTEQNLMAALSVDQPRQCLLMSHLPYLFSFRVQSGQSLAGYVSSLYNVYKEKKPSAADPHANGIKLATTLFYDALVKFDAEVAVISAQMDDHVRHPYNVLDSDITAISILI